MTFQETIQQITAQAYKLTDVITWRTGVEEYAKTLDVEKLDILQDSICDAILLFLLRQEIEARSE